MTIIEIEGYDEVGKSSLVQQLMDTYPKRFDSFKFPTAEYEDKIKKAYKNYTKDKTLDKLLKYHTLFLEDFMKNDEFLKVKRKKPLLVDRYLYSHAAYANTDLALYFINNKNGKYYRYSKDIMKVFYSFYSQLQCPDLVIFLERKPPASSPPPEMQVNYFYHLNFKEYAPKKICSVKALEKNTFEKVESILEREGYL